MIKKTIARVLAIISIFSLPAMAQDADFCSGLNKLIAAAPSQFKAIKGEMAQTESQGFHYQAKVNLPGMGTPYLDGYSVINVIATTPLISGKDNATAEFNSYKEKIKNCLGTEGTPFTQEDGMPEYKFESNNAVIRLSLIKSGDNSYSTRLNVWEGKNENLESGDPLCSAIQKAITEVPNQFSAIKSLHMLDTDNYKMYYSKIKVKGMQQPRVIFYKDYASFSVFQKFKFNEEADAEYRNCVASLSSCLGQQGEDIDASGEKVKAKHKTVFHQDGSNVEVTLTYYAADKEYTLSARVIPSKNASNP